MDYLSHWAYGLLVRQESSEQEGNDSAEEDDNTEGGVQSQRDSQSILYGDEEERYNAYSPGSRDDESDSQSMQYTGQNTSQGRSQSTQLYDSQSMPYDEPDDGRDRRYRIDQYSRESRGIGNSISHLESQSDHYMSDASDTDEAGSSQPFSNSLPQY